MSRDQLVTDWVAGRFPDQSIQITPASADASFRRYFRLTLPDGSTRILMDAPPDKEDCKPFIHVAGLLAQAKLCLLYTSPSPRDGLLSRMPSSA